jgi:coatomer subunit gamma
VFRETAIGSMNFDKKDEDSGALFHLDKTQVFQEARIFNASPISPKRCRVLLTKIKCVI